MNQKQGGEPPARILVVDDEADICGVVEVLLVGQGYTVCTANSGPEALLQAQHQHFDLVITDLRMPDMDGIEVLTALRRINPSARAILITGYASEESTQRILAEGGYAYLAKPFQLTELLGMISSVLK